MAMFSKYNRSKMEDKYRITTGNSNPNSNFTTNYIGDYYTEWHERIRNEKKAAIDRQINSLKNTEFKENYVM